MFSDIRHVGRQQLVFRWEGSFDQFLKRKKALILKHMYLSMQISLTLNVKRASKVRFI